ncbi:phosphotransferase [Spongiibacter nanhainus]|uniref:Phosphotransferase n=1 Tax=Spongiibacter nanhainus TaxID=2794344 RepID=A0A7T4QZX0_9GAMM|nr:PhoU domain-containing protein [Spongiibacter nanhainus]QQD17742.1 phosphotransferase [Spongiibacter nanhainus]
MIRVAKGIRDNLRFLCVEVDSQLENLQSYFDDPSRALARRIFDRAGYVYNLKARIHDGTLRQLWEHKDSDSVTIILRSIEFIATELERIAELCRECVKQAQHIDEFSLLKPAAYGDMLQQVRDGIAYLGPAIADNDSKLALEIGKIESRLDRHYNKLLKRYISGLKEKKEKHTEDLATALFIAHNVEQMGDALLTISESIISANLGQPVNLESFQALQASVKKLEKDEALEEMQVRAIAETRSGSAISAISYGDGDDDDYLAIYKEGQKRKLKEERQSVESWHEIYPGLAPKILSYKKRGQSASLLIEHLPGMTFEQILLSAPDDLLAETLQQLGETLQSVWRETRTDEPVKSGFMRQLNKRLNEVYKVHPEFDLSDCQMCGFDVASFDSLLAAVADYEQSVKAPFSVYIHGDFNVDNIIYDPMEKRINFIDLHRSRYMDYVQDVSVFMVSNYRLQILDSATRRRINEVAREFYRLALSFARETDDRSFDLRLALGLARSFASSTRFILDKSHARRMFLRARYLMEKVLATPKDQIYTFELPVEEIFSA